MRADRGPTKVEEVAADVVGTEATSRRGQRHGTQRRREREGQKEAMTDGVGMARENVK